jgi:hypothetical protein
MSHHAQKVNLYPKDMLKVTGPSAKVITAGVINDPYIFSETYLDSTDR